MRYNGQDLPIESTCQDWKVNRVIEIERLKQNGWSWNVETKKLIEKFKLNDRGRMINFITLSKKVNDKGEVVKEKGENDNLTPPPFIEVNGSIITKS